MKRPSERALDLAEEILDHVRHGLTRADALHELADMIDESNAELLRAARAVAGVLTHNGCPPDVESVARLREVLHDYQPWPVAASDQEEFFKEATNSPTLF
jgi:hypothetical protein